MEHFRLRFLYQHVQKKISRNLIPHFFEVRFHLEVMANFVMFSTEAIYVYTTLYYTLSHRLC